MAKQVGNLFVKLGLVSEEFDKKMARVDGNLKRIGRNFEQAGLRLGALVGAPLTILGSKSLEAYKNFDSAFTGVKKTVDGSEADFKRLEKGILEMTKRLPASAVEISKVAENAGQMGIKSQDLLKFTETMVILGETTNLSADQAATTLGKFATITNMSTDDFGRLGSTLVDLGNNFNGTEEEIASMAQRLAGAGTLIGLSQAEILGFSSALVSVGIEAEAGGTAFSRVFKEIQVAVEMGGQKLTDFAGIAGLSSEKFKELFKEDSAEAITRFLEGFGRIKEVGGSTVQTLEAIGLSEIRVSDATLRTANAQGLVRDSVEKANKAWDAQQAHLSEMAKRNGSLEAQMQLMRNSFDGLGIQIGKILAPQVVFLSEKIRWLVDAFEKIPAPIKEFLVYFGEAVTVVTAGALAFGALSFALGAVGIASAAPILGITALGSAIVVLGSYIYEFVSEQGAMWRDFFILKISEYANAGLNKVIDWSNYVYKALFDLTEKVKAFASVFSTFFGFNFKFEFNSFEPLKKDLIDVAGATEKYKQSLEEAQKVQKEKLGEAKSGIQAVADSVNKFLPKIPTVVTESSKAAAKEAKKAEEAIKKLQTDLDNVISRRDMEFLEKNYAAAIASGSVQGAEAIKNEIIRIKQEEIIEAYKDRGGQIISEATNLATQIAQIETDERLKGLEGNQKKNFDLFKEVSSQFGVDLIDTTTQFGSDLSLQIQNDLATGIRSAFQSGDVGQAISGFAGSIASAVGSSIAGPVGGALFQVISDSFISIGKSVASGEKIKGRDQSMLAATTGIATGGLANVAAFAFNGLFGDSKEEKARKQVELFLENILGDNLVFGKFTENFSAAFDQIAGDGRESFTVLGEYITDLAGVTEGVGEQIGFIFSQNVGGSIDEARLMMQELGFTAEDMEQKFVDIGKEGDLSWHAIEVKLQAVNQLTGEGLVAFGDLVGVLEQVRATGGAGIDTLIALRNFAVEAGEKGVDNISDLRTQLIATGASIEDADRIFNAFSGRGIVTMEQLRNASDRTLGGVAADLESLGFQWGEDLTGKVDETVNALDKLDKKLNNINKEVDLKINVKYSEKNQLSDSVTANALGNVFTSSGIEKFAKGGIFGDATLFRHPKGLGILGEGVKDEAILPLTRMKNGELGISAVGGGSSPTIIYNIDARGAQAGVEAAIIEAMKLTYDRSVKDAVSISRDLNRRGL